MGSKTARNSAAPQPALTRYKLLYIERDRFPSPSRGLIDFVPETLHREQGARAKHWGVSDALLSYTYHGKRHLSPVHEEALEQLIRQRFDAALAAFWKVCQERYATYKEQMQAHGGLTMAFIKKCAVAITGWRAYTDQTATYLENAARLVRDAMHACQLPVFWHPQQ
jgi:hypothetical protein